MEKYAVEERYRFAQKIISSELYVIGTHGVHASNVAGVFPIFENFFEYFALNLRLSTYADWVRYNLRCRMVSVKVILF